MHAEKDETGWIITLDPGMHLIGKQVGISDPNAEKPTFILNPVFIHMEQWQASPTGGTPRRMEVAIPMDMVANVPVQVTPLAFIRVDDLPQWRKDEIAEMVKVATAQAEAYASTKRSGLVLPVGGILRP